MAEDEQLLIAKDNYLKAGIHIGTKFKTKSMAQFIYKTRPDGLSVLNLSKIDERIKIAADFLSQYDPEDILIVSRRENGWKPVKLMKKILNIKAFSGRYPPGVLTNPALDIYMEAKVLFVVDPWPDRNAINDSMRMGMPIVALCDTNNQANNVDLVIPCNNKGKKSLGLFFYVLTREIMKNKGLIKKDEDFKYLIEDFTEE